MSPRRGPTAAPDAPEAAGAVEPGGGRIRRWWSAVTSDPLLRHRDFNLLWAGQSISEIGSAVSTVAIPLIAISVLHVSSGGMGVLSAMSRLPFLLYLFAGVFADRTRRRPILIGTDLARAATLALLCVAALAGMLSLWLLCVAVALNMALSVWFDIGYMTYLPTVVKRSELLTGNVRLETTRATATVAGPSLGGVLIQAVTAPVAIVVDAVSYVVSAIFAWRIRTPEPPVGGADKPRRGLRGIGSDLAEGLRFVARHRVLRPLATAIAVMNLAWAAEMALYMLFLARGLHLSAGLIGVTLAGQGPGTLVGSLLAGRVGRRFGLSGAVIGGLTLFGLSALAIPAAPAAPALAVPMLIAVGFLMSLGGQVCSVNVLTTRQLLAPDELLGRVNASFRFLGLGISPLGALAGGYLGQVIGLRPALYVAIGVMFVAPLLALLSPVRKIHGADAIVATSEGADA